MEGTVHCGDNQEANRRLEEAMASPAVLKPQKLPGTLAIFSRDYGIVRMMIVISIDKDDQNSGDAICSDGNLCETFTRLLPWNGKPASHWQLVC
jgi:hypothetical protein